MAMACMIMLSMVLVLTGTEVVEAEEVQQTSSVIRTPAEWETTESVLTAFRGISSGIEAQLKDALEDILGEDNVIDANLIEPNLNNEWIRDYGPISIMNGNDREVINMGCVCHIPPPVETGR